METGEPIGLLLALTYTVEEDETPTWTTVSPSSETWTRVSPTDD